MTNSIPTQSGCSKGKRIWSASTTKRKITKPIGAKAGFSRVIQCLRTTIFTVSSFPCPEKCHFLSWPRRKLCRPQRERPERQGSSSCGGATGLFLLSSLVILVLITHSPQLLSATFPYARRYQTNNK